MAKKVKKSNLDFVINKLKNSVGDFKLIEHTKGSTFGGIHKVDEKKGTVTIVNEKGLEFIENAEKDNLSTENVYSDDDYTEILELASIISIK